MTHLTWRLRLDVDKTTTSTKLSTSMTAFIRFTTKTYFGQRFRTLSDDREHCTNPRLCPGSASPWSVPLRFVLEEYAAPTIGDVE
jgi:hypothetical protein